jgi:hypothetical protein
MSLNESIVEGAALEWFGELGYAVGHGPHLAPGEHAEGTLTPALSQGERESYSEVVLVGRLREAIRWLNFSIPEEAWEDALRKVLRLGTPSLTQTNRALPQAAARRGAGGVSPARWQHRGRSCAAVGFRRCAGERLAGSEPVHGDRGASTTGGRTSWCSSTVCRWA